MRHQRYRSVVVLLIAAAIDFGSRFALSFEMARVAMAEAILFAGVAALLTWLARTSPLGSNALRVFEATLAVAFAFAALRAAIWAAGAPVFAANLITLVTAVLVSLGFLVWWQRAHRQRADSHQSISPEDSQG